MSSPPPIPPPNDSPSTPTMAADAEEQPPEQLLEGNPPPHPAQNTPVSEPSQTLTLSVSDAQDNDPNQSDLEASHPTPFSATSSATRRGGGGGGLKRNKSKRFAAAKVKKLQKKLDALNENLNPIPFKPARNLDFHSHEELLKRLGLWDFVNLQFDANLRTDLVAQLIAGYDPQQRASYVNETRIRVNRADLARALRLPAKKDKVSASESETEVKESEEAIAFVDELVSTWMLLHEDTWMMPSDIHNLTRTIKEGNFERVDWAGLIWYMVEKELSAAPNLGNCYYASHLQFLIKCQKENMLKEDDPQKEVEVKEEAQEEEEEEVKTIDDFRVVAELNEHSIELSLGGLESAEKDGGDVSEKGKEGVGEKGKEGVSEKGKEDVLQEQATAVEHSKEIEEQGQLLKISMDGNFLQHCSDVKPNDLECEMEIKQEVEQDDAMKEAGEGQGVDEEELVEALDGVDAENLLVSMDVEQGPLGSDMQLHANLSSEEFLTPRVDTETNPGTSSLFGNGNNHKRDIGHLDVDDDTPHQAFDKRIRSDDPYQGKASTETDMCLEQLQYWLERSRVLYMQKDKVIQEGSETQQLLMNELQAREDMIRHLNRVRYEENQKRQMEIFKLERELYMMGNLLNGYRKALKETKKSFDEYRVKCPFPQEPLYKDAGPGGLVLTAAEVEKERLRKEEEERLNRLVGEKMCKEFEEKWSGKFQSYYEKIDLLGGRLVDTEKNISLLKELRVKQKTSPAADCTPTSPAADCTPTE